jgi:hypothetical protein
MPTLSVTMIGIVIAITGIVRGKPAAGTLLRGIIGAWLGFVAGAVPGVALDVAVTNGVFVAVFGHIGAIVVGVMAVGRAPRPALTHIA